MRHRRGSLSRRLGLVLSLGAVAALAITSATAAHVTTDTPGSPTPVVLMHNDKITICHGAGHAGTTTFVTLTISVNAVYGPGGHFNENGTPQAGHEQDYFGPCTTPPEDDVCPNIEGNQHEIPDGMVKDEHGNCVTPPPVDVCPNIDGHQSEIPDGMVKDEHGNCVTPPPVDVCPNIDGNQSEIPDGMVKDEQGNCVTHPPVDVCPNIDGNQSEIPDGMIKDEQGNCVTHPPVDVCPNIDGNQSEIPDGMIKDEEGNCVTPPPPDVCPNLDGVQHSVPDGMVKDEHGNCVTPPTPPTPPSDEHMDVQLAKAATAQVQLVNGQADVAYTVRVRNNGPNQAHNVVLKDAAPSGVTFLAITLQPLAGNCTITPALLECTLGTLGPGVEQTIGFTARVTHTGTIENCAIGTGEGGDTNAANNKACASTLVTAPVTPPVTPPTPKPQPKPKPHPKPQPELCRVLRVTPGMVKANGKRHLVTAKVTKSRTPVRGVAVRFKGTGLDKVVRTNREGVAVVGVAPGKAGIMVVRITNVKACNSARIGVVGVFEPPVTG